MQIESSGSTFSCRVDGERGPWVLLNAAVASLLDDVERGRA
jgi:hypothetical protein